LRKVLLALAEAVARRLRADGLAGRTVTLKYRDEDFLTLTRAETLAEATHASDVVFLAAWRLFRKVHGRRRVRLLGVTVSAFEQPPQLQLFSPDPPAIDRLQDEVAQRFGARAIRRASLLVGGAAPQGTRPADKRRR
jgi:DNA polymerase IV